MFNLKRNFRKQFGKLRKTVNYLIFTENLLATLYLLKITFSLIIIIFSLSISLAEKCDMFKIDVDTLSAFKNQERDVIIISCTKKNGNEEEPVGNDWLYAAMTRVKHSLILYGTFRRSMVS